MPAIAPLRRTFRCLMDVLDRGKIEHVVVGALAVSAYLPARRSGDVDVLVPRGKIARAVRLARESFALVDTRADDVTVLRDRMTGVEAHLRPVATRSDRHALKSAVAAKLFGLRVRLPAPEYLVVMKLASMRGRRKHFEDVLALLRADFIDVRFVLAYLVREHPLLVPVFAELVRQSTPSAAR